MVAFICTQSSGGLMQQVTVIYLDDTGFIGS